MRISIIIVTINRPDCVQECLNCLRRQEPRPHEIFLIDASADDRTAEVVKGFTEVQYLRTDIGYGHMTKSRNLGLSRATGEIISFIDDDAFVHEGWLSELIKPYADPKVGGVGGRAINNRVGEATAGLDQIGRLYPDGTITGNFAADPGKLLDVDHLIGCNMSWRASALHQLGGLRDDYPGTEVREETDIALRVRKLGYRIVFQPTAVVTHIGAPQVKGKRFDIRYAFYAEHNHALLLMRNYGPFSPIVWRSFLRELLVIFSEVGRRLAAAILRFSFRLFALFLGTFKGLCGVLANGLIPKRKASVFHSQEFSFKSEG